MKEAPAENWEDAADAQNELPANDKKQTDQATGQPLRTRANTDIYIPPKEALTKIQVLKRPPSQPKRPTSVTIPTEKAAQQAREEKILAYQEARDRIFGDKIPPHSNEP